MSTASSVSPAMRASRWAYTSMAAGCSRLTSSSSVTMVTWTRLMMLPNSSFILVMRMSPKCLKRKPAATAFLLSLSQLRFLWPVCQTPSAKFRNRWMRRSMTDSKSSCIFFP